MVYGYARVSTTGQARDGNSLEAQESALRQAGAERIYRDVFSGKTERRPQLNRLLKHHHEARQDSPQSHSGSAVTGNAK